MSTAVHKLFLRCSKSAQLWQDALMDDGNAHRLTEATDAVIYALRAQDETFDIDGYGSDVEVAMESLARSLVATYEVAMRAYMPEFVKLRMTHELTYMLLFIFVITDGEVSFRLPNIAEM